MNIKAVILAAGYSSRMDGFKPLMRLGKHSLLAHCIRLFKTVDIRPVVVVGHRHEETTPEILRYGGHPLHNPGFAQGMFSSVKCAMAEIRGCAGFFMLPVDIPLVRTITVEKLLSAYDGVNITHPGRNGVRGHPPIIPGRLIPEILAHDGTGGLKRVLERHPGRDVEVWDDGAFMDADTRKDFNLLTARFASLETGSRSEIEVLAENLMPPKGVAHGRAVAEVANLLADELLDKGYELNPNIVHNGALLHDVAKGVPNHEARGGEMMLKLGLKQLEEAVACHRDARPVSPEQLGEKELVCLADKLVKGTRRVSVQSRFKEKLELYRNDHAACRAITSRLHNALALQKAVETATSKSIEEILNR